MALGVPEICAEVAVTVAVKVILWTPELSEMLRLVNLATPRVDVVVLALPVRFPGPDAFVAVTV